MGTAPASQMLIQCDLAWRTNASSGGGVRSILMPVQDFTVPTCQELILFVTPCPDNVGP